MKTEEITRITRIRTPHTFEPIEAQRIYIYSDAEEIGIKMCLVQKRTKGITPSSDTTNNEVAQKKRNCNCFCLICASASIMVDTIVLPTRIVPSFGHTAPHYTVTICDEFGQGKKKAKSFL